MIKTTAKHTTSASKKGAIITTSGNKTTNFYGSHPSQTITPRQTSSHASPPAFGRKSGKKNVHTTGGC